MSDEVELLRRRQVDQRPERPADAICEAISDAVGESLAQGQFQEFLRARGWALVHVGDGTCPDPPAQWLHDGLDMTESGWHDPVGRLEELWRQAWTEGELAGRAAA
jgi:hypothetical protein